MKLSLNTWVYSGFPCWVPSCPLEETIRRIARIGYDAIEIGAAAPHAYPAYMTPGRRRDIATCLSDNGIKLSSMLPAPGGGPVSRLLQPIRWSGRPPSTNTSLWQTFGKPTPRAVFLS